MQHEDRILAAELVTAMIACREMLKDATESSLNERKFEIGEMLFGSRDMDEINAWITSIMPLFCHWNETDKPKEGKASIYEPFVETMYQYFSYERHRIKHGTNTES